MRGRTPRLALPLLLLGAATTAAAAGLAGPAARSDAEEALRRAQLEQELIMAEGTAAMYGDLEEALAGMRREEGTR